MENYSSNKSNQLKASRILALDIGGVCVSLHFNDCFKALGFDPAVGFPPAFESLREQLSLGRLAEDEWLERASVLLMRRFTKEYIRNAWNTIVGPSLPGMKKAVEELVADGCSFAYLSDTSAMHIDHFRRTNDFQHLSIGAVFSYEVGAEKPSSKMYEAFERKFGIPFFYTDDRQDNIDAALVRGWRAERFTTPENFINAMRRLQ